LLRTLHLYTQAVVMVVRLLLLVPKVMRRHYRWTGRRPPAVEQRAASSRCPVASGGSRVHDDELQREVGGVHTGHAAHGCGG
jgi:hypothetical protein